METNFQLLVKLILDGDRVSSQQLELVSCVIIKNWSRKEKQELRWIASSGKPLDFRLLITEVIKKYFKEQKDNSKDFLKLEHYKNFLIEEFTKELKHCFSDFMNLLRNNGQQAWKIVFDDLENRSAVWFYKKCRLSEEEYHSVFSDSMELVYSKFMNSEFMFHDSRAFKSYFFKTLENKFYESVKDPYLKKSVQLDSKNICAFVRPEGEQNIERDERKYLLNRAFLQLHSDEQRILTDYFFGDKKLRDIASETGQSEENVRIKKHRALKKLFNHFKKLGYET